MASDESLSRTPKAALSKLLQKFIPSTRSPEKAAPGKSGSGESKLQQPIRGAIDSIFRDDTALREAITANLKERSAESKTIADRAGKAFEKFNKLSDKEQKGGNYVTPGADPSEVQVAVIRKGVEAIAASKVKRSITLRSTDSLKGLIKGAGGDDRSVVGKVELQNLIDFIMSKPEAGPSPIYARYQAEQDAENMLKKVENGSDEKKVAQSREEISQEQQGDIDQFVKDKVNLQMGTVAPPEAPPQYSSPRSDDDKVQSGIVQTFELRPGASDVTSYHDFNSLQIAFEHVWTRIFDTQVSTLGRELYKEYVKLKQFSGVDDGKDPLIKTMDDLKGLMDEIKAFSRPADLVPSEMSPNGDGTTQGDPGGDIMDRAKNNLGEVGMAVATGGISVLAEALAKVIVGKSRIRWDSFGGEDPVALPVEGDKIALKIEKGAVGAREVEFVLATPDNIWWWKAIEFTEIDPLSGQVISSDEIWTQDDKKTDSLQVSLNTTQLKNAWLEFKKAAFAGVHTGFYVLKDLDQELSGGERVTFTWIKD